MKKSSLVRMHVGLETEHFITKGEFASWNETFVNMGKMLKVDTEYARYSCRVVKHQRLQDIKSHKAKK